MRPQPPLCSIQDVLSRGVAFRQRRLRELGLFNVGYTVQLERRVPAQHLLVRDLQWRVQRGQKLLEVIHRERRPGILQLIGAEHARVFQAQSLLMFVKMMAVIKFHQSCHFPCGKAHA